MNGSLRRVVPVMTADGTMSLLRSGCAVFLAGLVTLFVASPAEAQQGYEFGLRFTQLNFRPVDFGGFSFQQASFLPVDNQPIQFDRIIFPALNSRTVRRTANRTRNGAPEIVPVLDAGTNLRRRGRLQLAVSRGGRRRTPARRRGVSGERTRLVLNSPNQPTGGGGRRLATRPTQFARTARSTESDRTALLLPRFRTADSRRSPGGNAASTRTTLSRPRREALARRFSGNRLARRGNGAAGDIRSARLAANRFAVRAAGNR